MSGVDRAWLYLGRQLRKPTGLFGSLVARTIGLLNKKSCCIAIEALNVSHKDTVLELGFGSGWAIGTLAKLTKEGRVFGIDHSKVMYLQASRRNRAAIGEGQVHLICGRLDALPWQAGSIDKGVAIHVAYFMNADEVREARRVLRPGGTLAVLVTDGAAMKHWKFAHPTTHRQFGAGELSGLLLAGGFSREEIAVRAVTLAPGVPGLLALATKLRGASGIRVASEHGR